MLHIGDDAQHHRAIQRDSTTRNQTTRRNTHTMTNTINTESTVTSTVVTAAKVARKPSKFAATFEAIDAAITAPKMKAEPKQRDNFERAVRITEEVKTGRTKFQIKGAAKSRPIPVSRVVERVVQLIVMGMKGDAIVLNVPDITTRCEWRKVEDGIMLVAKELGADLISVRAVFGFALSQEACDTAIDERRALAAKAEADVAVARANSAAKHVEEKKVRANGSRNLRPIL